MSPASLSPVPDNPFKPETAEDYVRQAWISHVQGDHSKADVDFNQAIKLDPNSVEAYYGWGLSQKLQGKTDPAMTAFKKVVELVNSNAMSTDRARGTMLRQLANWHIHTIETGTAQEPNP
jgi:tetratricopeptide (TPR) repeat protein